jgi:hypothetical protein
LKSKSTETLCEPLSSTNKRNKLLDLVGTKTNSKLIYCLALNKYTGTPKPPFHPALVLNPGDIVQITEFRDSEWWKGVKHRFNGSKMFSDYFKVEGYFPKNDIKLINSNENLEMYSWYLRDCDRDMAVRILNKVTLYTSFKHVFMVRTKNDTTFAMTVAFKDSLNQTQVNHLKINETYFDPKSLVVDVSLRNGGFLLRNSISVTYFAEKTVTSKYFHIDKRYFWSIVDLIEFYRVNEFKQSKNIGMPYREAMPKPIFTTLANHSNQSLLENEDEIELEKSQEYFVVKIDDEKDRFLVYNRNGEMGYASKKMLKIVEDN